MTHDAMSCLQATQRRGPLGLAVGEQVDELRQIQQTAEQERTSHASRGVERQRRHGTDRGQERREQHTRKLVNVVDRIVPEVALYVKDQGGQVEEQIHQKVQSEARRRDDAQCLFR